MLNGRGISAPTKAREHWMKPGQEELRLDTGKESLGCKDLKPGGLGVGGGRCIKRQVKKRDCL